MEEVAEAERHVAEGEEHLSRQRAVYLNRFGSDGHDNCQGGSLIPSIPANKAMHIAHRDRLRRELDTVQR